MRLSLTGFVVSILLFSLAACQREQQSSKPSAESSKPSQTAQAPPMVITLATVPDPPVSAQETTFLVTVADQSGKPVAGVDVKASLKMATMDMGKNEVAFTGQKAGTYEAKGKFTMAGPWNVIVNVTQQEHTRQQTFPTVVHKPGR
jgi:YtkA-like